LLLSEEVGEGRDGSAEELGRERTATLQMHTRDTLPTCRGVTKLELLPQS